MIDTESCEDYYAEVINTARVSAQLDNLQKQLDYLGSYACHAEGGDEEVDLEQTRCLLFKDFAPLSFFFRMEKRQSDGTYKHWFVGGLIYHGPHDNGGDGGAPTFSVNVNPEYGWTVHT